MDWSLIDATPELAVVVLAVGAPPELKAAVESLRRQSVPPEIIVVNSGGGDPHRVLSLNQPNLKIISVPERLWPGAARNLGIRSSHAQWVAFLASDHIADVDWVANRLAAHKKGHKAVACAVVNSHPRNLFAWASHLSILVRRLPKVPRKRALRFGASYARSLFDRYGQFREDLRIGEDTEFHERFNRDDRPAWVPTIRTIHNSPTTFRAMIHDQFKRGIRSGLHWAQPVDQTLLRRVLRRFKSIAPLSFKSVRGFDRFFVVASWPLLLVCAFTYERGVTAGHRQRVAEIPGDAPPRGSAVVAILDRDNWNANTDIIVVANWNTRRLTWVPRDLWSPLAGNRINAAFAKGGGKLLMSALDELGFPVDSLLCLRRAATEAALAEVDVTVPVNEPLDFWYPLDPNLPIESGRKQISFRPPEERLSGERLHQWIGARTALDAGGNDLRRLRRQCILLKVLLTVGFDFRRALQDPRLIFISGQDPLPLLADVGPQWSMTVFDQVANATIDGKAVLLRQEPVPVWRKIVARLATRRKSSLGQVTTSDLGG
jgi:GT2 family glycosyltransferase